MSKNPLSESDICAKFITPAVIQAEWAKNVRKHDVFTKYGSQAHSLLESLLTKYQDEGMVSALDNAA
jgi:hypothetical protein